MPSAKSVFRGDDMELDITSINIIDHEREMIEKIMGHLDYNRWGVKHVDVALAIYLKRRDDLTLVEDD